MPPPVFKDATEIMARFAELAGKFGKDPLGPITGKELAPFAAAISRLAQEIRDLENRLAATP